MGMIRAGMGDAQAMLTKALRHKAAECLVWPYGTSGTRPMVNIFRGKHKRCVPVRRLVAESYLGAAPNADMDVATTCTTPLCVAPQHLKWTMRDNQNHFGNERGETHRLTHLKVADVVEIRSATGSKGKIARKFGISPSAVWHIKKRHTWAHVE